MARNEKALADVKSLTKDEIQNSNKGTTIVPVKMPDWECGECNEYNEHEL
jgi:hypothetical protein